MIGILVSFWNGLFSGAMLVLGSVAHVYMSLHLGILTAPMCPDQLRYPHFISHCVTAARSVSRCSAWQMQPERFEG